MKQGEQRHWGNYLIEHNASISICDINYHSGTSEKASISPMNIPLLLLLNAGFYTHTHTHTHKYIHSVWLYGENELHYRKILKWDLEKQDEVPDLESLNTDTT